MVKNPPPLSDIIHNPEKRLTEEFCLLGLTPSKPLRNNLKISSQKS
jgi:hypothetical protein